jgi:hypothetical protein
MALDVKFSICQSSDCKSISFTEKTGLYNATTNTTGWGAVGGGDPNSMISDATAATISIKGPDGTIYPTIDLFALGNFPKSSTTDSVSIASTLLSSAMKSFADGYWEMTYTVVTGGATAGTYDETITFFFSCQVEKCVCGLIANLHLDDCNCDVDKLNEALQAKAYLSSLQYAVGCSNLNAASEILKTLQRICGCTTC